MTRETASRLQARDYAEKRKETRHEVQLKGKLRCGEKLLAAEIGDLSFSGALVLVKGAPAAGSTAELFIEDYGPIPLNIVHVGAYFCGVSFKDAASHRVPLLRWIGEATPPMQMREPAIASDAA